MTKESSPAGLTNIMIIISTLVLTLTALPDQIVWGMRTIARGANEDTCLLTLQLKEDPYVKSRYEALVISASNQIAPKVQSVDEMYADVSKASIEADEGGFGAFFTKNNSHAIVGARDIDNLSALCLGCHDGATAQDISIDVRNDPYTSRNKFATAGSDHPIGMEYKQYVSFSKNYKMITNPKMILVNGKVGCLTCHDPFNPEKGHLVMSDVQSALCLTCHNK